MYADVCLFMIAVAVATTQAAKYKKIREEQERRWAIIDSENQAIKQREQLRAEAVRAEEELATRREVHAQAKRLAQSRMLVHKGVQPCLRNAAQERKREKRVQKPKQDAVAEVLATGVGKLNIDPALSELVMKAEGPSVCVVDGNVSDEAVRELAALPYEEWKEEMRARKRQAEAEANAAAAAAAAAAAGAAAAEAVTGRDETHALQSSTKDRGTSADAVHVSRRGKSHQPWNTSSTARDRRLKPRSASRASGRLTQVEMAECTFRPKTGIPKAMAWMRQVLDAPDD